MKDTTTIEQAKQKILQTLVSVSGKASDLLSLANAYEKIVSADYSERMCETQFPAQTPTERCSCKENDVCSDCPKPDAPKTHMSYKNLAQFGYEAYSKSTNNKNFRGEEMPKFEELSEPIVNAWIAATAEIVSVFSKGISVE